MMYTRILIAYDGKAESEPVLREGVELAGALNATVILIGVVTNDTRVMIAEAMAPMGLPDRFAEEFRDVLEAEAGRDPGGRGRGRGSLRPWRTGPGHLLRRP